MKAKYILVAATAAIIALISSKACFADTTLTSDSIKLVQHYGTCGSSGGVGTKCFVDDDGEVQGMAVTKRHIVIAHSINFGYGRTAKVRVYFIDRKTLKIVKMIPKDRYFSCSSLGATGCYGHGSTMSYNYKTDKIWITTQDGVFQFDDKTMAYEKHFYGVGSSKVTYNQKHDWYWTGATEGDKLIDSKLNKIQSTNTHVDGCSSYEEGPGTWGDYLVTNSYRPDCGSTKLWFYNYKNSNRVKEFIVSEKAIGTDIVEQVGFLEDGTMILSVPKNHKDTSWGHGLSLYAVSAKTLSIGKSENTKIKLPDDMGETTQKRPAVVAKEDCASILNDELCEEKNADYNINHILNSTIDILTAGFGILGTISIIICGIMVMTAQDNEAKLVAARTRFIATAIGIALWGSISILTSFLLPGA